MLESAEELKNDIMNHCRNLQKYINERREYGYNDTVQSVTIQLKRLEKIDYFLAKELVSYPAKN